MKSKRILPVCLLVSAFLFGCGGGRTVQSPPDPLQPAAKAMTKGISFYQRGCYDRSVDFFRQAHEMYTAADDRAGAATALNNIGNVYRARKDLQRSLLYYDAAADLFTEISHRRGRMRSLVNRASVLIEENRLQEAEKILSLAQSDVEKGQTPGANWLLANGILASRKGDAAAAEEELVRALKKAETEQPDVVSGVHYALARLLLETGRNQEAADHAEAALVRDRRAGAVRKTADDLLLLGSALRSLDRASDAAGAFRRAMKIYALLGDREAVAKTAGMLKDTGVDALHPLTLEFVEQWLKQDLRSPICR